MDLRPLGFGEIFDRAITLYVRNFWPFVAIVLVLIVPIAAMELALGSAQSKEMNEALRVWTHPTAAPPKLTDLFSSGEVTAIVAIVLLTFAIWPFVFGSVAVGVARLYRGRNVEFAACYRSVLPRWGPLLLTLLAAFGVLVGWYVAFVLVVLAITLASAALSAVSIPLGIVAFVVALIVVLLSFLLLAPLLIALSFAMNAVVIENSSAAAAIGLGFRRIFNAREFWRSILFALAAFAVAFGGSLVVSAVAFAALLAHAVILEVALASLLRAAIEPFSIVLIAVYYFDVRIRQEGYDLEAELERMSSPALA